MNRGVLLACCGILFLLSAAITSRLANDDGPFEPRQVPQPIIADAPTIVVPPPPPETDPRREQLKRIISSIEAPDLEPALPIVGMVRMEDGTPIAGATIVARSQLERVATSAVDREERLIQWVEREVQEDRVDADPWQTTSDENGRFELTRLPLTRFLVSAKHPRWSFNRASRSTSPGSLVVFVAQEPKLEVDLQVRLADGSIPARAEVVFAPGRFASLSAANGTLIHGHFDDQGSTHIHQITSALGRRFKPWTPGKSTREVESGFHMVIARSADGRVSDPLEVFIEKSDGPQTILLEIRESGAVRVDVVQSVDRVSGFHYFLLQIDRLHPPPPSALLGGIASGWDAGEWPRTIPRVPPGTYLVGIGSGEVIWGHQIIGVSDQRVDVLFDLAEPGEGNFLLARVVDGQGKALSATFQRRAITNNGRSSGSVDSIIRGDDGIYRIALTEKDASADQFFLSARTDAGTIEVEVGEDRDQVIEFRFGSSARVTLNISGFDDLWRDRRSSRLEGYSIQTALVPPGEQVGSGKWHSASRTQRNLSGPGSGAPPTPGIIRKDMGTIQAGDYELVIGTNARHYQTLEVMRVPLTVGAVDLEIPIALPPLHQIEVLRSAPWPITIATPEGTFLHVFLDDDETTVTLPTGTYEISVGPIQKTIEVPRHKQVDLRGED